MGELINNKKKEEILYDYIIKLNYGDTILHQDIESIIQENHDSKKYQSIIQKAKKKLLESSKGLENIKGVGYRVIYPDDYTDLSLKYVKSGYKRIDTGFKVLQHAPVNDMSKEGFERYRHIKDSVNRLHAMVAGGCTEIKMLSKNSKLLPTSR